CSSNSAVPPPDAARENLSHIVEAYLKAHERLGRPPQKLDDLRPHLKADDVLRSPHDGERYVIVWGVNLRTPQFEGASLPVFIYERKGKGGRRYVATTLLSTPVLTDEEFRQAQFALGHRPGP